jgi:hypothetical protein
MAERSTWRGRTVAPRIPREAWRRFAVETAVVLAVVGGIVVIAMIVSSADLTLRPKVAWDYLWVRVTAALLVPLVLGYEIWLLWSRLAAFRRGTVFVDDDEVAPDAVPPPATRKRRETPAQARRRRAFWRELALVTAIWLFCTGLVGWVAFADWQAGRPLGDMGKLFLGLLVLYPAYVVLSVYLKNEKDRGR